MGHETYCGDIQSFVRRRHLHIDLVDDWIVSLFPLFFILNRIIKMFLFMTLFLRRKIIYFSKSSI